ncbi:Uma2 family endonuclease [Leptolyngbya sp. FACHB-671]|uniref:Uma2 family endonuclease n=1 Tax=Leptolyngbya sp. FACHB-671 TaxID=2692812 RepID=UPI0016884B06|nr:Uma2 family endonuclease [Leptolyngbya sp. FACHB-671]MBD2067936.1 Uma2 family endonuclease [Leptolyngbya sp. FACHB-671]
MSSPTAESVQAVLEEAKTNGVCFPPGDLYSNEPPLESDLHRDQIDLLIRLLRWYWQQRQDFYVSGNLTVYYSPYQRKSEDFRGPDFFVVLGTERKPRKSWVVWEEEGKYPNVIIELLSDSTAKTDRGLKKQIYQDTFRTPDYFWFDPNTLELQGFHLLDGQYQDLQPNQQGQLWSQQLNLYLGIHNRELRFFTSEGQLIPTPEEAAQASKAIAEAERQRAEAEQQRSEKLAAKLRALGIDPDAEA